MQAENQKRHEDWSLPQDLEKDLKRGQMSWKATLGSQWRVETVLELEQSVWKVNQEWKLEMEICVQQEDSWKDW